MSILGKKCIRISSGIVCLLLVALATMFLVLSFRASDNETLLMLGDSYNPDFHLGKKVQYTFIVMSFCVILAAAFGISAAFSGDHCVTYLFGYFMLLMFLFFGCIGTSMVILSSRLVNDFDKECVAKTGIAYSIDQIYYEGQNTMCTK